jgi:hypothetical protein
MIAIDSDSIGDTFEVSLSAILFSAVTLSIIARLLDSIANNPGDLKHRCTIFNVAYLRACVV